MVERRLAKLVVPRDLLRRQMIVKIEDRQLRRVLVVEFARYVIREEEIVVKETGGGHRR